jgi:hypothetical protein
MREEKRRLEKGWVHKSSWTPPWNRRECNRYERREEKRREERKRRQEKGCNRLIRCHPWNRRECSG